MPGNYEGRDTPQTGDSTGGPTKPIDKPLDKPDKQYLANESVPHDDYHEEPLDESLMENSGSFAKRFA